MRIGVFGGTFDPVHYGHLLLAECCREQCRLDQVWFLPAAVPPHKQAEELSSGDDRVAMLELAIGGHPAFSVSRLEITRGGISFTVESLTALDSDHPGNEWFFLMGADSLGDLPNWRSPARLCELATPVAVSRPGAPAPSFEALLPIVPAARVEEIRRHQIEMPQIGLSSTDIRHRVAAGRSIRFRTPRAVEKYIESAGLYRDNP